MPADGPFGERRRRSSRLAVGLLARQRCPETAEPSPEMRMPGAAAQTRVVCQARIRLDCRKSVQSFKGIICLDISAFEFYMPGQAVRSLWRFAKAVLPGRVDIERWLKPAARKECLRARTKTTLRTPRRGFFRGLVYAIPQSELRQPSSDLVVKLTGHFAVAGAPDVKPEVILGITRSAYNIAHSRAAAVRARSASLGGAAAVENVIELLKQEVAVPKRGPLIAALRDFYPVYLACGS